MNWQHCSDKEPLAMHVKIYERELSQSKEMHARSVKCKAFAPSGMHTLIAAVLSRGPFLAYGTPSRDSGFAMENE